MSDTFDWDSVQPKAVTHTTAPKKPVNKKTQVSGRLLVTGVRTSLGEQGMFWIHVPKRVEKKKTPKKKPLNEELQTVVDAVRPALSRSMKTKATKVRNFILNDLAPLTLPLHAAIDDSMEVLRSVIDQDPEGDVYSMLTDASSLALRVRIWVWITEYWNMSQVEKTCFFQAIATRLANGTNKATSEVQVLQGILNNLSQSDPRSMDKVTARLARVERVMKNI